MIASPLSPVRGPALLDISAPFRAPEVLVRDRWIPEDLRAQLEAYSPRTHLGHVVKACFAHLPAHLARELLDRISSSVVMQSALSLVVFRHPDSPYRSPSGWVEVYGEVSHRVVTDAGVDKLEDAFRNLFEPETWNYHGLGTGALAEAAADTALGTELTTQYNPDNTRATGTQSAPAANQYRSTGTNTVDAAVTVTEHGLFSAATAGTLFDRSVFTGVALASGDSLQAQYSLTLSSGG